MNKLPQVEEGKVDAIVNQVGALSLEDVFNAAYDAYNTGYFAQLEADDVDAIADQIGALIAAQIWV